MANKINLPVDGTDITPNPNNLTGEAKKYQELQMKFPRSSTGQVSFTASPSGITYDTSTHTDDINVYNKGEDGLMNLLAEMYAGDDGWIIVANDLNAIAPTIENNLTTTTSGKVLDAYQGYMLNTNKLDKTAQAADSAMLGGVASSGYQEKLHFYGNVPVVTTLWTASTTYTDYPYQAIITQYKTTGEAIDCKAGDVAIVIFDPNVTANVKFAPIATCGAQQVTIYCNMKYNEVMTIPTIVILVS